MRDPGLIAVDLVDVALTHCAGLDRREIGTGIGLGEHRGRQYLARRQTRQPLLLLLLGAAAKDQFGGDLRAGAERADADIAARQFLGDDAHRFLAETEAAVILRNGQAEDAQLGHLRDHFERDVVVAQVPVVGVRLDFAVGKLAHLFADRAERFLETAIAHGRVVVLTHQLDQAGAAFDIAGHERFERASEPLGDRQARQPDIGRADDLALAHRNAALDLREIFADPDLDDEFLDLAERAGVVHPLGVGRELAHRFDISGEPGKSVRGALLAIEQTVDGAILDRDKLAHRDLRLRKQRFGCPGGFAR